MRRIQRRSRITVLIAVALLWASAAAAESLREFSGRVTAVSGSILVVDNRSGDELRFAPAPKVKVSGRKKSWSALAVGDAVSVSWKIGDSPRLAHRVVVLPPRGE